MAQHILHSRHEDVQSGVTLIPSSGGVFEVTWRDKLIFSKKAENRFPEETEIDSLMDNVSG